MSFMRYKTIKVARRPVRERENRNMCRSIQLQPDGILGVR
jgi:hypothetical protein